MLSQMAFYRMSISDELDELKMKTYTFDATAKQLEQMKFVISTSNLQPKCRNFYKLQSAWNRTQIALIMTFLEF